MSEFRYRSVTSGKFAEGPCERRSCRLARARPLVARDFCIADEKSGQVFRCLNAAGATAERGEAHQPESHLIPRVLQVALGQAEDVKVFGGNYPTRDGTAVRDYIHISDLASAHVMTLEALKNKEQLVYNLGNGKGYSVREIIETARDVTGHPIPAVYARHCPRRPDHQARAPVRPRKRCPQRRACQGQTAPERHNPGPDSPG